MRRVSAAVVASALFLASGAGFARDAALHVSVTVRSEGTRVETGERSVTIRGAFFPPRVIALAGASGAEPSVSPGEPRVTWSTEWDGSRRVTVDF